MNPNNDTSPKPVTTSDILDDAQAWIDAIPERIGTHWPECHTDRHHATCLVRKLIAEIERLRTTKPTLEQRVTALERWKDGFYDV